jgi:hypothetical protein
MSLRPTAAVQHDDRDAVRRHCRPEYIYLKRATALSGHCRALEFGHSPLSSFIATHIRRAAVAYRLRTRG